MSYKPTLHQVFDAYFLRSAKYRCLRIALEHVDGPVHLRGPEAKRTLAQHDGAFEIVVSHGMLQVQRRDDPIPFRRTDTHIDSCGETRSIGVLRGLRGDQTLGNWNQFALITWLKDPVAVSYDGGLGPWIKRTLFSDGESLPPGHVLVPEAHSDDFQWVKVPGSSLSTRPLDVEIAVYRSQASGVTYVRTVQNAIATTVAAILPDGSSKQIFPGGLPFDARETVNAHERTQKPIVEFAAADLHAHERARRSMTDPPVPSVPSVSNPPDPAPPLPMTGLRKRIESRTGTTVLAMLPIEALRGQVKEDGTVTAVEEEILVAWLFRNDSGANMGRFVVGFWPGETGHEQFYLDDLRKHVDEMKKKVNADPDAFRGRFGMGTWRTQSFSLCAGTAGRWRRLTTTSGDIADVLEAFRPTTTTWQEQITDALRKAGVVSAGAATELEEAR